MLSMTFLGGAGTVTGSKHLLEFNGHRLLVDCGLFQGLKNLRDLNWADFPLDPASIDAVILTHAHLDHSGYIPKLVREGFRGPVLASDATAKVAELILKDSGHLQEKDAEYANRKGFSKHAPALPLYGIKDAERAMESFKAVPLHKVLDVPGGAKLTLRRAGHILGAVTADIVWGGKRVVFSGDLGRYNDPVMVDPEPVSHADYVIVESTYGDRKHAHLDPIDVLGEITERTIGRGGTVVIPAFAVGRAQSLLYYFSCLKGKGRLRNVPIYLDSPMAIDASKLFCDHLDDHKLPPDTCHSACQVAKYVRDVEESKWLTASQMPKVIISASGMATGGRVLHHIKNFGPDRRNTILFSGYQAAGTRGRSMVEGASEVRIHGEWVPIRAEIQDLPMLSAHADSDELLRWLRGFNGAPRKSFVVHGEASASGAVRQRIENELSWNAVVPKQGESYAL